MQFFPGKTNKQISNARRNLKSPDNSPQRILSEQESEESEEDVTSDQEEWPEQQSHDDEIWKDLIRSEVRTNSEVPDKWDNLVARLAESAESSLNSGEIDAMYESILEHIGSNKEEAPESDRGPKSRNKRKTPKRSKAREPNRTDRRRYAFAKCQELMNKCPKKLADAVAANDLSLLQVRKAPSSIGVRELYTNLWGITGPSQRPGLCAVPPVPTEEVFLPITPAEIERKIKRIANSSAAGIDGIVKRDLKSTGVMITLAKFFNLLLLNEAYPTLWKQNRTTLIPKPGKDPGDVKNWRPITISSMLCRIFSSLLDYRIRRVVKQSERQKGFTNENGCFANTRLLSAAIVQAKEDGGVFTILDISKAFDTVPHEAIRIGLQSKGIPTRIANYIVDSYKGCNTAIKTKDGEIQIELKRGVKQGDPLSPLLFNLVIEPIIERVQNDSQGVNIEGHNLAAMAFADDIILLARDQVTATYQAKLVSTELRKRGMALSIEKSSSFQYVPRGRAWYVKNPEILVRNTPVPYGEPDQAFKYLGATATPWKGLVEGFELDTFQEIINRVKTLPIKPMQKINLLRVYLLPRFTYGLVMRPPARETLKNIDAAIRTGVRKILHLHETTSSAFLYTPTKQGGLGLIEIYPMVLLAALRNATKAAQSKDELVRSTISNERSKKLYESYAAALRLPWPVASAQLDKAKNDIKLSYKQEWSQQLLQGQGVEDFASEPLSNSWLTRSDLLSSSRIIDAIKLRTNTYPTRATMKRAHKDINPICRACGEADETLGHILGQCRTTKVKRIKRHNDIVNLLKERLAKHNRVMVEPLLEVAGERLKPDLVISNEERVLVLDVTVRYENKDFLAQGAKEKTEKYKGLAQKLKTEMNVRKARVVPIVVGSRGALPVDTTAQLRQLEIRKRDWLTIAMIALRSSIEIANAFMDN